MKTKFGNAEINSEGYYAITTSKEGNANKRLHRLIYENYYKCTLLPTTIIHHKDGNKINNCILNLEAMTWDEHTSLHWKGRNHTEKSKLKMSKSHKGKTLTTNHKIELSKSHNNSSGIYRVCKHKDNTCKQGFLWSYQYYEDNKRKYIKSVDLNKLKNKVIDNGLEWIVLDEEKANLILNGVV